jgi:hypothetical protein
MDIVEGSIRLAFGLALFDTFWELSPYALH